MKLEYRHPYHHPEWETVDWPYDQQTVEAAAEDLAEGLADQICEVGDENEIERTIFLDDLEIRHQGRLVEF